MPCKNCKCAGHNSRTCPLLKPPIDAVETVGVADDSIIPIVHVSLNVSKPVRPTGGTNWSEDVKPNKKYYCYIVKQVNGNRDLTYVGYTVNPSRRIRQHSSIIKGGAIYTTKYKCPWEFLVVMTCPYWNNVKSMQTEWLIKHPTRKRKTPKCFYGAKGRIDSLIEIFKRIPEEEKIEMYIHPTYYNQAVNLNLPENVNIRAELNF
jgi:predicted GIY-YIG superfamily endonuclease